MAKLSQTSTNKHATAPIGVFDSGIGGLVVAKEIAKCLPNEKIIYFGDLAHTPWGNKSTTAIQHYAEKITDFLLKQNCKIIVIACNTASAVATEVVLQKVKNKAYVVNVIDPVISYIKNNTFTNIGLIGTKQTITSRAYNKEFEKYELTNLLYSIATPLLVPLIEEGYIDSIAIQDILENYLHRSEFKSIDALILGCTHYPLIENKIQQIVGKNIHLINSAKIVTTQINYILKENNLFNYLLPLKNQDYKKFFLSEPGDFFVELLAKMFPNGYNLEHFPLWD